MVHGLLASLKIVERLHWFETLKALRVRCMWLRTTGKFENREAASLVETLRVLRAAGRLFVGAGCGYGLLESLQIVERLHWFETLKALRGRWMWLRTTGKFEHRGAASLI